MIIDTHVHVVAEDQQKYPRTASGAPWVQDMSAETLLALNEQAGIDRTVLVQAYSAYAYDNRYTADCALAHPDRFASVCILDPLQADAADQLSYWVKERGMRGLRLFTSDPENCSLDDPKTYPVWERAESLNIPLCVFTRRFTHLPRLRSTLERFPNVRVALDHLGMPRLESGPPYESVAPLLDLARFPNLYLKFSTVSMDAARSGSSTAREFFGRLMERFGSRRMMWGSNFPATYDRTLKEQLELARRELAFLPEEDQRWLFGETALTLWPMLR
jgi:predicted TIM-barrel fold metal-dependent hydrolase